MFTTLFAAFAMGLAKWMSQGREGFEKLPSPMDWCRPSITDERRRREVGRGGGFLGGGFLPSEFFRFFKPNCAIWAIFLA